MINLEILQPLVENLISARDKEENARKERIAIEEQIAAFVPTKETGQKTVTFKNGVKIIVKRGLNYKADLEAIRTALAPYDVALPIQIKITRELDVQGYEYYRKNHPSIFSKITPYVSVVPRKTSVTVKAIE